MTEVEKRRKRVVKWRGRGWSWERVARKVGLPDRRFAQIDAKRWRVAVVDMKHEK